MAIDWINFESATRQLRINPAFLQAVGVDYELKAITFYFSATSSPFMPSTQFQTEDTNTWNGWLSQLVSEGILPMV